MTADDREGELLTLLDRPCSYIGIGPSGEGMMLLEARVKLLPSRSPVDLEKLRTSVEILGKLQALGMALYHYDEEWVVANIVIGAKETEGLVDEMSKLLTMNG